MESNREPLKVSKEEGDEIRDKLVLGWKRDRQRGKWPPSEGYFNNLTNVQMDDYMCIILKRFHFLYTFLIFLSPSLFRLIAIRSNKRSYT